MPAVHAGPHRLGHLHLTGAGLSSELRHGKVQEPSHWRKIWALSTPIVSALALDVTAIAVGGQAGGFAIGCAAA
ncbi:MAG: hypothetical protein WCF04_12605 [Candidatus Nanopelagicales bacterium]